MKMFDTYLIAYQNGEVRPVKYLNRLPDSKRELLEGIFYLGQNDHQPVAGKCSLSAGDVIDVDGEYWQILGVGFRKLTPEQFAEMLDASKDPSKRMTGVLDALSTTPDTIP